MCHWNIVNFHQSHKTNVKDTHSQNTFRQFLLFYYIAIVNKNRCDFMSIVLRTTQGMHVHFEASLSICVRVQLSQRNKIEAIRCDCNDSKWRERKKKRNPVNKESTNACFTSNITRCDGCRRHTCHCPLKIAHKQTEALSKKKRRCKRLVTMRCAHTSLKPNVIRSHNNQNNRPHQKEPRKR